MGTWKHEAEGCTRARQAYCLCWDSIFRTPDAVSFFVGLFLSCQLTCTSLLAQMVPTSSCVRLASNGWELLRRGRASLPETVQCIA